MKKTTKEMIEVMEAFEQGEEIEYLGMMGVWANATVPTWDWENLDYRVKEYKYPMWFESNDGDVVVRFDSLYRGEVISTTKEESYYIGEYTDWTPHTCKDTWTQIDEPKAKEKVTIEKWLLKDSNNILFVVETSDIDTWLKGFLKTKKVKLLESYTVEI